jgi:IPT/TIG domain
VTPSPFRLRGRLLPAAVLAAVLVLGVVAVVWARGGLTDRSDGVAGPSTSSPATATTDGPVEPTTSSRDGGLVFRVIQWINEEGPLSGGASGPDDEAFEAMLAGDCRGALRAIERSADEPTDPIRSVYLGAANACLAAFEGQPELWPRAEASAARVAGQASRLACETRAIYRLLERLLEAHRADPGAQLRRGPVGVRGVLSCPLFTSITPDHGPAEGGYPVRITGEHLTGTVGVRFDLDHRVQAVAQDGALTVTMPPASVASPGGREVMIWPDGAPAVFGAGAVYFTYDPPSSSSSATTEPSTSTPDPPDPSPGSSVPPPPPSS